MSSIKKTMDWHTLLNREIFSLLQADPNGLSGSEARTRFQQFGPNQLKTKKGKSLFLLFFKQFANPLVFILIGATIVKFSVGGIADGAVLSGTIFIMAVIGFLQEARAERAMHALKELSTPKSKVKRDGKLEVISSYELVPGDVIILEPGDKVPADARLIEAVNFKINESILTGESTPIEKHIEPLLGKLPLAERRNMIYTGTIVSYGRAKAVVIGTGMATEIGKIAASIADIKPVKTPLQKSIQAIGGWMILIVFLSIFIFTAISFYRGMGWMEVFLLAISAAVSAIPEGLPVAVTVVLAAGMNAMAKRNAIVRKLVAVETLGSTTVICSDKTGTLTLNQMNVENIFSFGNKDLLKQILEIGALCNDALITKTGDRYEVIGDATEGALLIAAAKSGFDMQQLSFTFPRIDEIPFRSENRYMATLHSSPAGKMVLVKGAPEKILSFAFPLKEQEQIDLAQTMDTMSKSALRLIAVGYCDFPAEATHLTEESFKGRLIFTGVFGIQDPPRQEAIKAVAACKEAGIKVVMATGDNKMTASAIAHQLGIINANAQSGEELEKMSEEELKSKIVHFDVFARVEPLHKLKIVEAYQSLGHVVAMTGDGVNDAPALEAANIGVSMGISGTEVAKEASDIVLSDDNFASVVAAVEEGRAIFNRLRNVCTFLLTTCFGELLGLTLCVLFTGLAPLLPLQILWINLVTGVIIAVPLGLEPKTGKELKTPPRDPKVELIFEGMKYRIAFLAIMLSLSIFFVFKFALSHSDLATARTMILCNVIFFEWLIAFNVRSDEITILKLGVLKNIPLIVAVGAAFILQVLILHIPFFQTHFMTVPLTYQQWIIALFPSFTIFIIESVRKITLPTLFSKGKWRQENKKIEGAAEVADLD